ncbi:cell wall-binding repeat-containing protein [Pyrococcus kukulkanii]|uniref:cell wall-binding repeat-containing protein n=1 Tax=Pyrococcus kukulkanii TaxID=1609559 RepID=UPI003561978B
MRKVFGVLIPVLLVLSGVGVAQVSAETQSLVILVSDNEADLTLAQKVGELLNATVVVTKWGMFNESVISQIVDLSPDIVLIIGGPLAVVSVYKDELENLGINVTRIGGQDRVETNQGLIEFLLENYPDTLNNVTVAIAYGWDYAAMLHLRNKGCIIPILVKNDTVNETIVKQFRNVEIVRSKFSERIMKRVKEKVGVKVREVIANITSEEAKEAIEVAQEKVTLAESILANVTNPSAERLVELAKEKLELAKKAYEEGKYGEAFGLAVASRRLAEVVISYSTKEFERSMKMNYVMRLRLRIRVLERVMLRLEAGGANVSIEKELLEQAKMALKNGDIGKAKMLIGEIEKSLREKIKEKRINRGKGKKIGGR